MNVREAKACRSCGSPDLASVLDLGNLCVSDFVDEGTTPERAPLELVRCTACALVQLRHTVDQDRLYRTYWYRSGTNETMRAALLDVAFDAAKRVDLGPGDAVLDVGCNDGTLLGCYPKGVRRIGVDPSDVAQEAHDARRFLYEFHRSFFPAPGLEPVPCKVVTAIACFYDLDDPNAFLAEVKRWLHPDGVFVVQFQDLHAMVRANAFDNVCHEHLCYYDYPALVALLKRNGLRAIDHSYQPINGGSLRVIAQHDRADAGPFWYSPHDHISLDAFAERVRRLRGETVALLEDLRRQGKTVLGYAASTKANTLLQFYGLGPEHIAAFMERSPQKWGKRTVGTGIPIISEEEGRAMNPAFLFVGAWQFADAFAQRERALLEAGTQLIVPLPNLRLVGGAGADVLKEVA